MPLREQIQYIKKLIRQKYLDLNIIQQIKECIDQVCQGKRYRNWLTLIIMLAALFSSMPAIVSHYLYLNPVFTCQGQQGKINQEQACKMLDFCKIINQQTLTAYLQLYCDKKQDRIMIQSTNGIGTWVGIMLSGIISDKNGRKFALIIGLLFVNLGWIVQIIGVYFKNYDAVLLAQFLSGVSVKLISVNCLILLLRFLNKEQYHLCTIAWYLFGSGLSTMMIAGINHYLQKFMYLIVVYSIGNLVASLLSFIFIYEDPVFCFNQGNIKRCKQIILSVAEINRESDYTKQHALIVIQMLYEYEMKKFEINDHYRLKAKVNFMDVLQFKIIMRVVILGIALCFCFVGVQSIDLSITGLSLSYDFILFLLGISICLSYICFFYLQTIEQNYKRGFLASSLLCGIVASLFAFKFTIQTKEIQMTALFLTKFFLCWTIGFIVRMKVKIFPEKYQGILLGSIEMIGNLGKVITPSLVQKVTSYNLNTIFGLNIVRLTIGTLPILLMNTNKIEIQQQKQSQDITQIK